MGDSHLAGDSLASARLDLVRVLHVQRAKGVAGSERHLLVLLPALMARGVEVRMCVLEAEGGSAFTHALRDAGIEVAPIAAGPDLNPVAVGRIVGEIRRYQPDLVHTHLVHGDLHGLVAAWLTRTPAVSSVHGCPAFYQRPPWRSAGRLAGRIARRRIAISAFVAGYIEEHGLGSPDRTTVIHYGIDADKWSVGCDDRRASRHQLGFAADTVVVGIASRLIAGKGHTTLLEAFGQATKTRPELKLVILGDGPLREELEAASQALPADSVRFLGWVDNVRNTMAACDVVVFPTEPSLGEGFGLAALEAMATGAPVVATRVGSLPEVVTDEVTGLLVAPSEPAVLAEALARLTADRALRRRLGKQAASSARRDFGLDRMVDATLTVYRDVAPSR